MKYFIKGWLVGVLLMFSYSVQSQNTLHFSPPSPYPVEVTMPNGQTLQIVAKGNDEVHWSETIDGYTVIKTETGYYEYAKQQNGELVASGIVATDPEKRNMQQARQLLTINKHLNEVNTNLTLRRTQDVISLSSTEEIKGAVPHEGKVKLLAICIEYPDLRHSEEVDYFYKLLNEGVDGKPSFRQYFLENSYGKMDLSVDVVGWVQASKNYSYYGDENGKGRTRELVKEAIQAAEALGVDYSQYDNDDDNDVDGVLIIHSGPGAEEGSRREYIWSHRWTIPFEYHDDKFIFDYMIQPETRGASYDYSVGIGIFCHEFGHLLGLPDLYDIDLYNGQSNGIGNWGLMGLGQWLGNEDYPSAMTAWSKESLGWAKVENITQDLGRYSLSASDQSAKIYRIDTKHSNEYFLLENRQQKGFDQYQRGSGIAIWHINTDKTSLYPSSNSVNGDENLKGVDLEEADGNADLDGAINRSDAGDLFPGSSTQQSFSVFTNPTSESYARSNNSTETGISIEAIEEAENGTISFLHTRMFSNSGVNCQNPFVAFLGENTVKKSSSWFEFSMPEAGSLRISTEQAGRPTSAEVFADCNTSTPLAEASSPNNGKEHVPMNIKYLAEGEKILIRWNNVAGYSQAFKFNIEIEGSVNVQDSLALIAMYNQMGGSGWSKKDKWLNAPVSSWEGVTVNNGRVTRLDFYNAGLKGSLPGAFYSLKELRSLTFADNSINGTLDKRFGQLTKLEEVFIRQPNLNANFLSELSALKQLKSLKLQELSLSVGLPQNIDQLSALEHLEIQNSSLSGGIPSSIGNLVKLKNLILTNNNLTGSIPTSMGGVRALQFFNADNNQLSGTLPAELVELPVLKTLSVEENRLSALPTNLFSSNSLTTLNLSNNLIGGELPKTVIRTATAYMNIDLSGNQLTGIVSENLSKINYSRLDLSENELEGKLPALKVDTYISIAANNFTQLEKLQDIGQNQSNLILWCQSNALTFEDLTPNLAYLSGSNAAQRYSPQDTIKIGVNETVNEGATKNIAILEDEGLTSNRYQWYLNEESISNANGKNLEITNFSSNDEGTYLCKVTNTQLEGLILNFGGIQLTLKSKEVQVIAVSPISPKSFGDEDFDIEASSNSGLGLTYSRISGPIELTGSKVSIKGAGVAKILISQPGNSTYHETEQVLTFNIAKASQEIEDIDVSQKTYGDSNFVLPVIASSGLPVALKVESGNVVLNNNEVSITGAGDVVITASQNGSENYLAAMPKSIRFSTAKAPQSINFSEIDDQVYGNEPLSLSPTSTADLPVTINVEAGNVQWSEGQVVFLSAGSVTLRASQPGNENYQAATPVLRTFDVAKAGQEIFFDEIYDRDLADPPLQLEAFSSVEGFEVYFRLLEGEAEISEANLLTVYNTGNITVEAYHPGSNNYNAAEPVQQSFFVSSSAKETQTISLKALPDTVRVFEEVELDWSVSSGLEADILIDGSASLNEHKLTFTAPGLVRIRFEQKGNEEFNQAFPVEHTFVVSKASQTINVSEPGDIALNEGQIQLQATSESGLPVMFRIISGNGNVQGDMLRFDQSGEVVIEAFQEGNELYEAAEPTRFSLTIYAEERQSQTISYEEVTEKTYGDAPFPLNLTSTSELPITIETSGPVSLAGQKVSIEGAGEVTIKAYQAGNDDYAPSDTVFLSFTIEKASQNIAFEVEVAGVDKYLLKAQSDAGLPISFEIVKGEAEIIADTLFFRGDQEVEVVATQAGNENYQAAEPVTMIINTDKITSIDSPEAVEVSVFPNPSQGVFILDFGSAHQQRVLEIHTSEGKQVYYSDESKTPTEIDLSAHAPGVYLLRVQHKNSSMYYRLIKR
ncbi:M6 family metalloprotease-like protein [Catalinimonas alkaloidigena]|uniref:M6 family metalloprotease domain-containing protein n=1 Tax=Catalinimonas alkaloidigena TaxID=1075417 RepID=UPI0024060040|nr:M6 family metalloprotease domain-containing protein [Catalinimonas alkaloidigena]MDF9796619.1 M6 family metalloprotease-like protein [Catalinimonas alkaloidigena]